MNKLTSGQKSERKFTIGRLVSANSHSIQYLLVLTIICFFCSPELKAQDPQFTQFYATPVYTNPALAGTGGCFGGGRVALNYRNQWPSLPGTFVTTAASWDQHFDDVGGGLGLMILDDRAGEGLLTSTSISGIYSYQLKLRQNFALRFGIQGEYGSRSIDWQRLRFEDQINPELGFVYDTKEPYISDPVSFVNFSAGVVGYTDNFYAGFAVHNITEPNQSFYGTQNAVIPRRYTGHGGVVIPLDGRRIPETTISPNVLFMLQNQFSQMNVGFYLNKGDFISGLWFRQTFGTYGNSDALIALVGFKKDKFKFGYSYDITVSDAKTAAPGSHEISTSIEWCPRNKPVKYKGIDCPKL